MNRRMIDGMSWRMAEVYGAVVDRILVNLARHFAFIKDGAPVPGAWQYQIKKLAEMDQVTRESEAIILEMLGDADYALQGMLEETIRDALKDVSPSLRKAAERGLTMGGGFLPPNIAPRQMQAFTAFYQQSADKLNLVNTVMLESTEQAYRATVADIATKIDATQRILNTASGEVITGTESFNKVLHDSVRQMVNVGLTGFIDHGGHHWSPEAYVAMDTRTTMTNTARAAVWEDAERYGVELYQVSSHDGARPLCYPWQGKVISKNGWTGVVKDGDGNEVTVHSESEIESFRYGGGLFGVNCGHYPIPFVPGFSRSRPPEQNAEENAKEYAESQKQRALERKLREERRELAVMKAQGATEDEINAQKMRVKNARTNLDDFCTETGRARQRSREYTPVNATFPDGYQQTEYMRNKTESLKTNPGNVKMNAKLDAEGNITSPMDETRYSRMRTGLERNGVEVIRAEGDDLRFLRYRGAEASYWDGRITHIGEIPSASAMFEETIHAAQARIYGELRETNPVELSAREIAAQEKLLKNGNAYGFAPDDFTDIQANRDYWAKMFKDLTGKEYDPNDRTSEFYRGV